MRRPQAVVERAQHVHAVELLAARQPRGRGAGGDHEAVVAEPIAAVEPHEPLDEVEADGPTTEAQVEVEVLVGRRQRDPLGVPSPASTCFDSGGRS